MRVAAHPEATWDALKRVTPSEAPPLRALFALRGLPAAAGTPILEQMLRAGFELLGEEAPRQLVAGATGQPWRLLRRLERTPWADANRPDLARMALDFRLVGDRLATETRVFVADEAARRKFARYWLVVRHASGLTRRSWLHAVKRRAEN